MLTKDDLKQLGKLIDARLDAKFDEKLEPLKKQLETVELKVELVNTNLKKAEAEIIDEIRDIVVSAATQAQVIDLERRVAALEKKLDQKN